MTDPQLEFVRSLQKRLHLPNSLLDSHCIARFKKPFAEVDIRECSALLDEMKSWVAIPAELQREAGQLDMFGVAG